LRKNVDYNQISEENCSEKFRRRFPVKSVLMIDLSGNKLKAYILTIGIKT